MMKAKLIWLVTASVLLVLIASSVAYSVWGKASTEAKVCANQRFTLGQLDVLAATAAGLVSTSNANRTVDETEKYIMKFEKMRYEIKRRADELNADYC